MVPRERDQTQAKIWWLAHFLGVLLVGTLALLLRAKIRQRPYIAQVYQLKPDCVIRTTGHPMH